MFHARCCCIPTEYWYVYLRGVMERIIVSGALERRWTLDGNLVWEKMQLFA